MVRREAAWQSIWFYTMMRKKTGAENLHPMNMREQCTVDNTSVGSLDPFLAYRDEKLPPLILKD